MYVRGATIKSYICAATPFGVHKTARGNTFNGHTSSRSSSQDLQGTRPA
jgi:hypothetical protein